MLSTEVLPLLGFISYNGGLTVNSGLLSVRFAHDMSELTK